MGRLWNVGFWFLQAYEEQDCQKKDSRAAECKNHFFQTNHLVD